MLPRAKTVAAWLALAAFASLTPDAPASTAPGARTVAGSVRSPDPGGLTIGRARIVRAPTADELAAPMRFSVSLLMRDFAGLQARIAAGEHIPQAEMEARYLPLRSDYDRLAAWLAAQGFEATLPDRQHTTVFVKGSVSAVSRAFGVQFARVAVSDGEYTSAVTEPAVPADLAPVVLSVNGLQPQFRLRHLRVAAAPVPNDAVNNYIYVTPDNVASAYNIPAGATGAGQVIAIVGEAPIPSGDLTAFWSATDVAQVAGNVTTINVDGGPTSPTSASLITETALDVEWAGALAPGALIRLYLAGNAIETYAQIMDDLPSYPTMSVISSSYGNIEGNDGNAVLQAYSQTAATFAAAGVSILASSGDAGSNPNGSVSPGDYLSTAPLAVTYPASDPSVTGVGGTTVSYTGNWAYAGEVVWNQISDTNDMQASASGGGVSSFFAKPSWQTGGSVLAGQTMRCVPDVAAIADSDLTNVNLGAGFEPFSDQDTGVLIYNSAQSGNNGHYSGALGTSLACPVWAAITALIDQARASNGLGPIGLLNPHIYPLAGTIAFNDVVSGNNGAYSAGPGYDLCTGIGSPNVTNLIAALAGPGAQRLANISTRALVGTGANILIPGLYISGTGTETLLIRGDGPSLIQYGVSGVLAQPTLSVFDSTGKMVASNTGWDTGSNPAQIATVSAQVGAFPFAAGSADCALIASLTAGSYTVQLSGVNNATGVALAEVYEVSASGSARLANISTRAMVGTGGNIVIPGIHISGQGLETLLIRGDGPSLTQYGVSGVLAQPTLSVFNSAGDMIASNTGWGTNSSPAQITTVSAQVGAFPFAAGSADCALVVSLEPGSYTIQISGVSATTGVALAEVYEVASQ
jgi:kumamolisin